MAGASSYFIPSLIGGVSAQAPQDRAPATAELQENCINNPLHGAMSRPGSELIGSPINMVFSDPFEKVIKRGTGETYQLLLEGGQLKVINLETGALCSVTGTAGAYLNHTGAAREAFDAVTVEDTTFIVNRQTVVKMSTAKSPVRPNYGLFYFKSGSYKTTYKAIIKVNGVTFTGVYTTPDNSTSANEQYIKTNQLAASLTAAIAAIVPSMPAGCGVFQSGSMVIFNGGPNTIEVDSEDGLGDTQLIAFKDWVKKFTDLPARCIADYVVGVRGSAADQKSDYWLKYVGNPTTGYWQEVVKPETQQNLLASTMPVILTCTGPNAFTLSQGAWGARLAGDGDDSAKDPPFVGRKIRCISFIAGRLALITAGGGILSRARNAYVFFPDTAQTKLDTDPIPFGIENGSVPDIRSAVPIADRLLFWGDGQQLKLNSGDANLTVDTVETLPSTNYEYDGRYPPLPLGLGSLVFGNRSGLGSLFTEVSYRAGNPIGEIPLNDHCPEYIPGSIRRVMVNGQSKTMCVVTDTDPSSVYLYQWLNQGDSRIQTAWNRWTFPGVTAIYGGTIKNGYVYLTMEMGGLTMVERIPLAPVRGPETDVRLDHRFLYSLIGPPPANGQISITLPYAVPEAARPNFKAVRQRVSSDGGNSGSVMDVTWTSATTVIVKVGTSNAPIYFGSIPVARRRFSDFHIRDRNDQPVIVDSVNIQRIKVGHKSTSGYSLRAIRRGDGEAEVQKFNGREAIDRETPADQLPRKTGSHEFALGVESSDYWIELVNDEPFPCTWVSAKFYYSAKDR